MSIAAKSYRGEEIGRVTIAKETDEKGARKVYTAETAVYIGTIHRAETTGFWVATREDGRETYADTRGQAAGHLIDTYRGKNRLRRIEAERAAATLAAEQMIENCTTEEDVKLGRLYQELTDGNRADVHRIDQGYNPAGSDAIVLGPDEKLHRVKLLGHRTKREAPAPDLYGVDWGDHLGSVIAGIVIPSEIIEAEKAEAEAAARRPIDEAIARVERYRQVKEQAGVDVLDSGSAVIGKDGDIEHAQLTLSDLRTLLEAIYPA